MNNLFKTFFNFNSKVVYLNKENIIYLLNSFKELSRSLSTVYHGFWFINFLGLF